MPQKTVSATWVRGVMAALAGSGLDVDSVCREAGIDRQVIEQSDAGCPTEKLSALWEVAAARSGNPAIGLARQQTHLASFDVVGYAMMSSATLLAGLERMRRYLRLLGDDMTATLTHVGDTSRSTVEIGGGGLPVPRSRYESSFLTLLTFCRWMAGRELQPWGLELTHPAPSYVRPYLDAFGCPVRFSMPANSLVFSTADLVAPLPTSNPIMLEMLDRLAGERIEQLDKDKLSAKVCELIQRKLPDGEPGRAAIASALHLSERTLQRQLQQEGTSFQQLMDETRRDMARRYLAQPGMSLGETAYLLGFAEQSIFTRACKRWFQLSPGQMRLQLAAG